MKNSVSELKKRRRGCEFLFNWGWGVLCAQ